MSPVALKVQIDRKLLEQAIEMLSEDIPYWDKSLAPPELPVVTLIAKLHTALDAPQQEAVAKCVCNVCGGSCESFFCDTYQDRNDWNAHPTQSVPEGWQLVPKEPTWEMQDAPEVRIGAPCIGCGDTQVGHFDCAEIYKAMLSAAPKAPTTDDRKDADSFDILIADARAEAAKAIRKFPQPNYVISKFAEEAGEVVKAAIHCAEGRESADNLRDEIKQAIAMLYRLWIEGDQVHGLRAVAAITTQKGESNGL